jgi:hypothetical protein
MIGRSAAATASVDPTTALADRSPGPAAASVDTVAALTGYVLLLTLVPAHQVVPALGGVGAPANVYALGMLMWYTGSWLIGMVRPLRTPRAPRVAMAFFGLAVLASYVAAALRAPSGTEQQAADRGLIQLVAWISVVLLASVGIRDYARLQRLLRYLVLGAAVMAAIGLLEFFMRRDLLASLTIPGLQNNVTPIELMGRGAFVRPPSTAIQPLEFGAVMVMVLPFALQQAFEADRPGRLRRWLAAGLIAAAAPLSISRTAVIGLMVVLVLLVPTWSAKRRWPAYGVLILALGAVKVAVPGLIGTLTTLFSALLNGGDSSTQARTMDYAGVARYIAADPITGRGYATFLPALYRYTDNMYLLAVVEIGVLGVLAILVLFGTMIGCGWAGRRASSDPQRRELGQSFVAAGTVVLISSATFDTLSFPIFAGAFFLLLGCSGAYLGICRRARAAEATP